MEAVHTWLRGVVLSSLLVSVIISLVPEGSFGRIARFTGGLIFILVVLQPLSDIDLEDLSLDFEGYRLEIEAQRADFEKENEAALSQGIAQRTEAYILDKAEALDLAVLPTVEVAGEEGETPTPVSVTLAGEYSEELSIWIEETLNIPAEKQNWSDGT